MKISPSPSLHTIEFPGWYGDPRDFHEFVLRTYLESQKLKLARVKKNKIPAAPKLLYLPIKKDMIGVRYTALSLSYLCNTDYQRVCFFIMDYDTDLGIIKQSAKCLLRSEFQDIAVSPAYGRGKSIELPLDSINNAYGYLFSILACITLVKNVYLTTMGGRTQDKDQYIDPTSIQQYISASKCKQDDFCCVFVGDFDAEQHYPIMGAYFEIVAQMFDRKPRAAEFATDIGDMFVQVA